MEVMKMKGVAKYEAYKHSGEAWLGEVPTIWEVKRLGNWFTERRTKVSDKDFPPLSVTKNGIVPQLDSAAKSNDGDNRKLVIEGDFVINSRSDRKGSSGIAFQDGSVSLINIVMAPQGIYPQYSNYLLKSNGFIEEFYRNGHGIVADLWTTRYDEMKNIKIAAPSLPEQTAIATFLDEKTAKIDQAIAQKEQLISLLKERKQILIQELVTGKKVWDEASQSWIKPAETIGSGVEWIGEIPKGWEVKRLRLLTSKIGDGLHGTPNYTDGTEYYFINGNNLAKGFIEINEITKTVSEKEYKIHKKNLIPKRTLLLSINGTIGNVATFNNEKVMLGKSAAYVNIKNNINVPFLKIFLNSGVFKRYYELELSGSTIMNLSLHSIGKTPIIYPPENAQLKLVDYIDRLNNEYYTAITLQQTQITKLKEYKTVLIDNAVTGKIKVPEV